MSVCLCGVVYNLICHYTDMRVSTSADMEASIRLREPIISKKHCQESA